jgi:transposase InsO family protein
VCRCTIERLMREHGWRGITRARIERTTVSDPAAVRAPDLVNRCFTAEAPDGLWQLDCKVG